MKKLLFLFCIFLISQCKQKPFESKQNNSNFIEEEVIYYQYDDSGKLVKVSRKSYLMVGNKPDSLSFVTTYFYDGKGRKIKVEEHDGSDELLSSTFFNYDSRDSLLAEYIIDTHGDTTTLVENTYGENGNLHLEKYRQLLNNQSEDDLLNGKSNYDTLFTLTENFYQSGLQIRSTDRDGNNALVAEREYEYDGQRPSAVRVYEFPDSKKQLSLTHFYLLDAEPSNVERVTLNILGDTVGIKRVERKGNGKIGKVINIEDRENIFITHFNESGQIIKEVAIIKEMGEKITTLFSYDPSGRKVKEVSQSVPLTEEENNML